MVKIYESPDGGETVFERDTETGDRICCKKPVFPDWYVDDFTWYKICEEANRGNKTLQNLLRELILIYNLSKEEE